MPTKILFITEWKIRNDFAPRQLVRKYENGKKVFFRWNLQMNYAFSEEIKPDALFFTFVDFAMVYDGDGNATLWEAAAFWLAKWQYRYLSVLNVTAFWKKNRHCETQLTAKSKKKKKKKKKKRDVRPAKFNKKIARSMVCWRTSHLPLVYIKADLVSSWLLMSWVDNCNHKQHIRHQ